jgi:hypothetical protein
MLSAASCGEWLAGGFNQESAREPNPAEALTLIKDKHTLPAEVKSWI